MAVGESEIAFTVNISDDMAGRENTMIHYLIDAFNLVYAIPEVLDSASPHRDLISCIKARRLTGSANNRVTLVFDGFPVDSVMEERNYSVVFARHRTADEVIIEIIGKEKAPRGIVVVSDDHVVQNEARLRGATVMKNASFLGQGEKKAPARKGGTREKEGITKTRADAITKEMEAIFCKK